MGAICSSIPGMPKMPELSFDKKKLTGPIKDATKNLGPKREAEEAKLRGEDDWKDKSDDEIKKEAAKRVVDGSCKPALEACQKACWKIVEPLLDSQIEEQGLDSIPDALLDKAKNKVKKMTVDKMVRSAFIKAAMGKKVDEDGDGVIDEDGAADEDGDGVEDGFQDGGDEGGDDEGGDDE